MLTNVNNSVRVRVMSTWTDASAPMVITLRMDRLLWRGCYCEYDRCSWRVLHRLVRCGVGVVWFCLKMRIVCLWSLLSFVIHSFVMRFTGSCHNWCMATVGTLVTFLLYSAVVFYVVIIADSLHLILVTLHRYAASRDSAACIFPTNCMLPLWLCCFKRW